MEVQQEDRRVPLRGVNQRAVLAFLLLHANKVVPASHLIRALWQDDTPLTARKMLHNAIAGLRGALRANHEGRDPVSLVTQAPGYVLQVSPDQLDLLVFQQLWESGRAALAEGSYDTAAGVIHQGLALWRGPALADLVEAGFAWSQLAAVQGARMAALEDCAEAHLAVGRHHRVVDLLETTVPTEPTRERMCAQLMIALYGAGRHSEALGVYRRTRYALVEELGLDPSRELQALERAILEHDPALGLTASGPGFHSGSVPAPRGPGGDRGGVRQPRATEVASGALLLRSGAAAALRPGGREGERELALLRQRFSEVADSGRPHSVAVFGESPAKADRLITDFAQSLAQLPGGVGFLRASAEPPTRAARSTAIADLVRAHAGIEEADADEVARQKLVLALRGLLGAGQVLDWACAQLLPLVAQDDCGQWTEVGGEVLAVRRLLEELAGRGALVVAIENLHWADELSLGLVEALAACGLPVPLLLVTTALAEPTERRPPMVARPHRAAAHPQPRSVVRMPAVTRIGA
ncbi:AfsR/SARP family transcriptional regulator [Kitasatospora mediocidica]|uniref:AfsR/SARP family transcriptional regulator n=1 Tax=Kitasatospora mediocidica TaxID=58352 RepID=UPI00068EB712|nr:AfsR/SARP family transcriptional regulator [Kitasatospora mediocidica]